MVQYPQISVIFHINKLKIKNHMIISINSEKAFDKIQYPFIIKTLNKVGMRGICSNIIKPHMISLQKKSYSIIKSECISVRLKNKKSVLTLVIFFNTVLEVLITEIRQEKEIKCMEIRKKEVKLSLFGNDIMLHLKNAEVYPKPLGINK